MTMNPENWDGYLAAFRTWFLELNSTDPNRFPTGKAEFCLETWQHEAQTIVWKPGNMWHRLLSGNLATCGTDYCLET